MTALVTGASGGLGRAVAVALAEAGHDVGVHYRGDEAGAAATAARVRAAGCRAATLHADLAVDDADALDRACDVLLDACTEALAAPAELPGPGDLAAEPEPDAAPPPPAAAGPLP